MQFAAREDVRAPIETVFRAVADFDGWERAALRRGAEISRTDSLTRHGTGMSWDAKFTFHNRPRTANVVLEKFDAPRQVRINAVSTGIDVTFVVELVSLSRERTRMDVFTELKPTTISSRLLLQPLKLARTKLSNRFRQRIASFAGSIEDSCS